MSKSQRNISIEHKVIAIIDNFQCSLPEIRLSKNLSIRNIDTLSEDEQSQFTGDAQLLQHLTYNLLNSTEIQQIFRQIAYHAADGEGLTRTVERGNFVLYWHIIDRFPEPLGKHYDVFLKPSSELEYAISALRVLKDAVVGLYPQEHFYIKLPLPQELTRGTHRPHDGYQLSNPNDVEPYILLEDEIETLVDLLNVIRQTKQSGILTALSRLDNQYTRAYLADRLIDVVIGLEALYAGDIMNEIALRVGLRLSAHLGGANADLRESYFDLFNLAYNLRSRLVHGSIYSTADIEKELKKKGWQNHQEFMIALDKVLRDSLRFILLYTKDRTLKQQLHDPLDRAIRRGEVFSWNT
jgi:hypothetical protein